MQINVALLALLMTTAAGAQTLTNVEIKGIAPKAVTAESTTESLLQTLAEITPSDWQVQVKGHPVLPENVTVNANISWLQNLDQIGRAANVVFEVDAHRKMVTVEAGSALAAK